MHHESDPYCQPAPPDRLTAAIERLPTWLRAIVLLSPFAIWGVLAAVDAWR